MLHTLNRCIEKEREYVKKIDKEKIAKKIEKVLNKKIQNQNAKYILSFLSNHLSELNFDISEIASDKSILHSLISLKDERPLSAVLSACEKRSGKYLLNAVNHFISVRNNIEFTPFLHAIQNKKYNAVHLLLKYKKILNLNVLESTPMFGLSALHYAAKHSDGKMLKILLQDSTLRANVNIEDNLSFAPAHYAAQSGRNHNMQILNLLTLGKVNFQKKNCSDETPIDIMLYNGLCRFSVALGVARENDALTKLIDHIQYLKGVKISDTIVLMNVAIADDSRGNRNHITFGPL